jgi:hypothetical protein
MWESPRLRPSSSSGRLSDVGMTRSLVAGDTLFMRGDDYAATCYMQLTI